MYKITISEHFKKQLKSLVKKDLQLKNRLKESLVSFEKDTANSIGKSIYKFRVASQSKGKSGGYRIYVFILEIDGILTPLCIYKKNEKENIEDKELLYHLNTVKLELGLRLC